MKPIAALIVSVALAAEGLSAGAQQRWHGGGGGGGFARGRAPAGPFYRPYFPVARPPQRRVYAPLPDPRFGPPNSLGAGWAQQQDEARMGVRRGAMAPLSHVVEGISQRTPGRPLDAGIEYQGGRAVYRVRWITNRGRRIDYIVDAATGAVLWGK